MTQDEKREYIAIHGMSPEELLAKDFDTGQTYTRFTELQYKVRRLGDKEAFALEGARSWAEFEKEKGVK